MTPTPRDVMTELAERLVIDGWLRQDIYNVTDTEFVECLKKSFNSLFIAANQWKNRPEEDAAISTAVGFLMGVVADTTVSVSERMKACELIFSRKG
jgi:hypothetical protein